jgi:A/G-specific adenine glycosylase
MRKALLAWYRLHCRDLPWRRTRDPYAVWISEIMLQQTRVDTVIPYYKRFMAAMPDVHVLAAAPLDRVLELWSGLGYYRRARLLHRGASEVAERHGGRLPRDPKALAAIAGIGRYTAGAIASIAHGLEAPIVDGNVARVLSRVHALVGDPKQTKNRLWMLAQTLVRGEDPGDLNQALMELGATVCTPKNPSCEVCPLHSVCEGRARGIQGTLPHRARKTAPRVVRLRAFVIETGKSILCGKRKPEALYGGMWEPLMLGERDNLRTLLGMGSTSFLAKGRLVHVLTHRRLVVDVFWGRTRSKKLRPFHDYEIIEAVAKGSLPNLAMSRLARRTLTAAFKQR